MDNQIRLRNAKTDQTVDLPDEAAVENFTENATDAADWQRDGAEQPTATEAGEADEQPAADSAE
jgi:hypothetical protein